jgi:hypothetical protein
MGQRIGMRRGAPGKTRTRDARIRKPNAESAQRDRREGPGREEQGCVEWMHAQQDVECAGEPLPRLFLEPSPGSRSATALAKHQAVFPTIPVAVGDPLVMVRRNGAPLDPGSQRIVEISCGAPRPDPSSSPVPLHRDLT